MIMFGVWQPLVMMVFDGCPPSVQWWNGYLPSLNLIRTKSRKIGRSQWKWGWRYSRRAQKCWGWSWTERMWRRGSKEESEEQESEDWEEEKNLEDQTSADITFFEVSIYMRILVLDQFGLYSSFIWSQCWAIKTSSALIRWVSCGSLHVVRTVWQLLQMSQVAHTDHPAVIHLNTWTMPNQSKSI